MKQLKKILFPTDFSRCANQALSRAHSLAKQYGAELHMLHGIVLHEDDPHHPAHHFPDVDEIHARLKNSAEKQMDSTLTAYGDGIQVVKAQDRGIGAAPVILDYAKKKLAHRQANWESCSILTPADYFPTNANNLFLACL